MSMESINGGLPPMDEVLERMVFEPAASQTLFEASPVLWTRTVVGFYNGRPASEITDADLLNFRRSGGFAEWDPLITDVINKYLNGDETAVTS